VCGWRHPATEVCPPAIGTATTVEQVAEALYKAHLQGTGDRDLSAATPFPDVAAVAQPLNRVLSDEEAFWYACGKPKATAPGPDIATTADLESLWHGKGRDETGPLGRLLPLLYRRCLAMAYYPQV
jgi:hypothetical protein